MKVTDKLTVTNEDNMELMSRYPDNYFDLAIVDPPYGIGVSEWMAKDSGNKRKNSATKKGVYSVKEWDSKPPTKEYFNELFRVSKNQIIWGANNMTEHLNSCSGWIFWDKNTGSNGFSDGELAYTSFKKGLRKFKWTWNGMIQQNMKNKQKRQHPTQKPIELYEWLLMNYAKEGDKILDTHLGSGSIALACHNLGFELTACELDQEYYDASIKRIENHVSQIRMF